MKTALLLIAHGSRNADANLDLIALAEDLRRNGPYPIVESAFLELASPNIESAARQCMNQGAERLILTPYFLSAGIHVKRDLQAHRDRINQEFPTVEVLLAQPLGPHLLLREIVLQRAQSAAGE